MFIGGSLRDAIRIPPHRYHSSILFGAGRGGLEVGNIQGLASAEARRAAFQLAGHADRAFHVQQLVQRPAPQALLVLVPLSGRSMRILSACKEQVCVLCRLSSLAGRQQVGASWQQVSPGKRCEKSTSILHHL